MVLIRVPKGWEISENSISSSAAFFNRRQLLRGMAGAGMAIATAPLLHSCQSKTTTTDPALLATLDTPPLPAQANRNLAKLDRPLTRRELAAQYNNFYEFGSTKTIWANAQALPTSGWNVEVTGLVSNPQTYDIDDFKTKFDLEERRYRFRCVEAWSMALPWIGFPMKALIDVVQPKSKAKYVQFTSFYDREITKGPQRLFSLLREPYTEGLRLDEMANELAFFALGIYGHDLPKQHGAPIRAVIPWKYGFKGAKSIVKIDFVEQQPATYWNTMQPREYGFEANVNPKVPHPRWSQAQERFLGQGGVGRGNALDFEMRETLLYNGYEADVGKLYA